MFRKPGEDNYYKTRYVVKAKPISEKYAKILGKAYSQGKDFVVEEPHSQSEQSSSHDTTECSGDKSSGSYILTDDEKNKIHAKILKAEIRGDSEMVNKLKRKLDGALNDNLREKNVIIMKQNRCGNIVPATNRKDDSEHYAQSSSRVHREYGKRQNLEEMVREEKTGTAEDQLRLFSRTLIKSSKIRRRDDESVDDIAEMQHIKQKVDDKDKRKYAEKQKRDHQRLERTLDDCARCIESKKLAKHCIVAIGIHTYLAVVDWDGLDDQHCLIVPTTHASSTITLDENVWDEMRLWRKGLNAMWRNRGQDCVFLEMSRNINQNPHVIVECVPLPSEIGEITPIYFNKAINECEDEYTNNKKLIEIKDIRKQIPRGFSYFAVDFGLNNGYAHVIEDPDRFPSYFAHEIIAGMLDLPPSKWRKKTVQGFDQLKQKCQSMKTEWEPYDWTKKIKHR